jgi:ABC-type glycerol-3-phosphate transport system permease component
MLFGIFGCRFCLAANVIGFVYSGFMICDLVYLLSTSIRRSRHNLRHFLEFGLDQMLAYLLASASTSASIRVDDWQSNWGADKFPDLARASVALSYVSFVAFAFCSLASGYALCALRSI